MYLARRRNRDSTKPSLPRPPVVRLHHDFDRYDLVEPIQIEREYPSVRAIACPPERHARVKGLGVDGAVLPVSHTELLFI